MEQWILDCEEALSGIGALVRVVGEVDVMGIKRAEAVIIVADEQLMTVTSNIEPEEVARRVERRLRLRDESTTEIDPELSGLLDSDAFLGLVDHYSDDAPGR